MPAEAATTPSRASRNDFKFLDLHGVVFFLANLPRRKKQPTADSQLPSETNQTQTHITGGRGNSNRFITHDFRDNFHL